MRTGCNVTLPDFKNTEEAVRFGQFITRDQFIFLAGARAALKREFRVVTEQRLLVSIIGSDLNRLLTGKYAILAWKMQLLRECMEAAPDLVLASMIGAGIVLDGPDPEASEQGSGVSDRMEVAAR